jgi:hypothetical protein
MPPSDGQFYRDALREVKTSKVILPDKGGYRRSEVPVRHMSRNATKGQMESLPSGRDPLAIGSKLEVELDTSHNGTR